MPRAGIIVTGTEILTGHVADANGPWLSEELRRLGVDVAHICICGDRPGDLTAQLDFLRDQRVDLIITSGGLGPTADDLTMATVAEFGSVPMVFDPVLAARIMTQLESRATLRQDMDWDALRVGIAKQATLPQKATVLEPVGTAPGVLLAAGEVTVLVLPGPPYELQRMWRSAVQTPAFHAVAQSLGGIEETTLRLYGITETDIAETLRHAETELGSLAALEITTCLRRGEVEVVTRFQPSDRPFWEKLERLIADRHRDALFSTDGSTIDEQISGLIGQRRLAVAESCTAGLLGARIADVPGSSRYFVGGIISYANEVKVGQLRVDPALLAAHGAVSAEVADAMAAGALDSLTADIAVSTTGIAGPGGGTPEKPVGTVCFCVKTRAGASAALRVVIPGDRNQIRERATTVALHLLRQVLEG